MAAETDRLEALLTAVNHAEDADGMIRATLGWLADDPFVATAMQLRGGIPMLMEGQQADLAALSDPSRVVSEQLDHHGDLLVAPADGHDGDQVSALVRTAIGILRVGLRAARAEEGARAEKEHAADAARRSAALATSMARRSSFIEAVLDIQRSITGGTDIHAVLDAIVDVVARLLGRDLQVSLQLVDTDDATSTLVASYGIDAERVAEMKRAPREEGLSGRALLTGRMQVAADEAGGLDGLPDLREAGIATAMSVPIVSNDRVHGVITVSSTDKAKRFSDVERETLAALANQAAIALADAQAEQRIREALLDGLTGLPNRTLLMDRIDQAMARTRRDGTLCSIIFIDLDRFKIVNDSLGHAAGDQLLVEIARRVRKRLRETDTCARLGGDEFAVLLVNCDVMAAAGVARNLINEICEPVQIQGRMFTVGASAGVADTGRAGTADELVRNADLAMYEAKRDPQRSVHVYEPGLHAAVLQHLELSADLESALAEARLDVAYQPIIDLATGAVRGAEALVRWHHEERGWIPPSDFVPLAEDTGLIVPLGLFVLQRSLRDLAAWRSQPGGEGLYVSVNISPGQLFDPRFIRSVQVALRATDVPPPALMIEVTEHSLMSDVGPSRKHIGALREMGVRVAIDDFGTGYSSLTYLREFDFDVLKVDRAFMPAQPDADWSLLQTILGLCSSMSMVSVAEGIEHEWQRDELRAMGCDLGQGWLLGRPMPAAELHALPLAATRRAS